MPHRCALVLWTALLMALSPIPAARAGAQHAAPSRFELGLAPVLVFGVYGDRCVREASDLVGCSILGGLGGELTGRVRLSESWSVGLRSQAVVASDFMLLQLAAEARLRPLPAAAKYFWLGLSAGALVLRDVTPVDGVGNVASVSALPDLGGGLGADFPLSEWLSLGFVLRTDVALSGARQELPRPGEPAYGTQVLLSGGVALTVHL